MPRKRKVPRLVRLAPHFARDNGSKVRNTDSETKAPKNKEPRHFSPGLFHDPVALEQVPEELVVDLVVKLHFWGLHHIAE